MKNYLLLFILVIISMHCFSAITISTNLETDIVTAYELQLLVETDSISVIDADLPTADFTSDATAIINRDVEVTFTDNSTNLPTAWSWTFTGGTPTTSSDQNPSVKYFSTGTFDVSLTVTNAAGSDTETKTEYITVDNNRSFYVAIANGDDDVEESGVDGGLYIGSSDLELCYDGTTYGNQYIGLRFQNTNLTQGATITSAYIKFRADEDKSGTIPLTIAGDNNDNSEEWDGDHNVSDRTQTTATVSWSPADWTSENEYDTDDLTNIIQEIVNRDGWEYRNALSLIIYDNGTTTNFRTADSYEGDWPARLYVEYEDEESFFWTGNTSTDWSTISNWSENQVPTSSDDVIIPAVITNFPNVDETSACNLLTINEGASITISSGAALTTSHDIFNWGTLRVDGGVLTTSSEREIYLFDGGELDLNGGTVNIGDEFRTLEGCRVDISGGFLNIGDDWEGESNESAKGTISLSGGAITIEDNCKFSSSDLVGSMSGDFTLTVKDDFKISSTMWSTPTGGTIILTGKNSSGTCNIYSNSDNEEVIAYNLILNGTGKVFELYGTSDSGDNLGVHIYNNFTVTAGTVETVDPNVSHLNSLIVDGDFTMGAGAVFKDAIEATETYNVNTFSIDAASSYELYGNTQNIPETTLGNLVISSTGTKSLTGTTTVAGNLTITDGVLSIPEEKKLSITGTTSNSVGASGFIIKSSVAGTGSVIFEGTVTGNVTTERFLTHDRWHYIAGQTNISGNFDDLSMELTGGENGDQFYRWDEASSYWIDILNGADGTNSLMDEEGFIACKGYAVNYITNDKTLSLNGVPFTENQNITIKKTTDIAKEGSNLIGNPYTSTIAINSNAQATNNFISQNKSVLDDAYEAIYLWNEQSGWEWPSEDDYVVINNLTEATYIEPGQAFMIVAENTGNSTLNFNKNIRKHGSASYYKNSTVNEASRFELGIINPTDETNSVMIGFLPEMTEGLDPAYDAAKISANENLALYTKLVNDNGTDFAIQALPPITDPVSVKVGLRAEIEGFYNFLSIKIENFDEDISIFLEDKQTGVFTNLSDSLGYAFSINQPGTYNDRFELHFKNLLGVEENINDTDLGFYVYDNQLHIINKELKSGNFKIYNMLGQTVLEKEFSGSQNSFNLELSTGYYVVIITDKNCIERGKVFVK